MKRCEILALPNFGNFFTPLMAAVIFRFAQEGLELLLPYIGRRMAVLEEGFGAAAATGIGVSS